MSSSTMPRNEGRAFSLADLQIAMSWSRKNPKVRLLIAVDHQTVEEAIEIGLDGVKARWCLWQDDHGHLHVDDWSKSQFDMPFFTLSSALAFIETTF